MIREAKISDAQFITAIYNYYIKNSIATFEEKEIDETEIENRIKKIKGNYTWIVYEDANSIRGYAYTSNWKERNAYRFTAELTVYVENGHYGKGIGSELMDSLIEESRKKNLHKLMGGIALPNEFSIRLHEKFGFQKCAHFRESGFKFGKWIDVGYWELILQ